MLRVCFLFAVLCCSVATRADGVKSQQSKNSNSKNNKDASANAYALSFVLDLPVEATSADLSNDLAFKVAVQGALRDAEALVDAAAQGSLLARLRGLGDAILYRELPVLVAPEGESGPTGAVSGVVDLVYRDPEDGKLVIADYKTDAVEDAAAAEGLARRYEPQGAVYRRGLREALGLDYTPRFELWLLRADRVEVLG